MIYDVIIVGGGASGLFAAASFESRINGLILNNSKNPGTKLLLTGSGQCNLTKSEDIKKFLNHYGNNGLKIRKPLYKFSNQALIDFFQANGLPTFTREDGKVFPKSLNSKDILSLLLSKASTNGFALKNNSPAVNISYRDAIYTITSEDGSTYSCKNLIVATGGQSYPITGSNGSMAPIFSALSIATNPCKPSLVPIFVEDYNFISLSGISFSEAIVTIQGHSFDGGLLFTHKFFSGPAILDASRYASPGTEMIINYLPTINPIHFLDDLKTLILGNPKQISTVVNDYILKLGTNLPKRFLDLTCQLLSIDPSAKASSITGKQLQSLVEKLSKDTYKISGTAGYTLAMCTAGGVCLDEIDLNSFVCKKYPHFHIIGEALDVDGDTGGYNLQFAFSSGAIAAKYISTTLI